MRPKLLVQDPVLYRLAAIIKTMVVVVRQIDFRLG